MIEDPTTAYTSDSLEPLTALPAEPISQSPGNHSAIGRIAATILAWVVIIGIVAFLVFREHVSSLLSRSETKSAQNGVAPANGSADEGADRGRLAVKILEMQGRYLVGAKTLVGNDAAFHGQARALDNGPMEKRLRCAILMGELSGATEALDYLEKLPLPTDKNDASLKNALEHLYEEIARNPSATPSLSDPDRARILSDLGWYGALALHPADGPDQSGREKLIRTALTTCVAALTLGGLLVIGAIAGILALMVFLSLVFSGEIRSRLFIGPAPSGIYAETFALYFGMYLAANFLLAQLPGNGIALSAVAILGSLLALAWPLLRGIPWHQVRNDIGWIGGRTPFAEPLIGILGYVMSLPLLAIGVAIMFMLLLLSGHGVELVSRWASLPPLATAPGRQMLTENMPVHPIVFVDVSGWLNKLLLVIVACVAAPIVEETMFRGVLYRHLRGMTAGWRTALSAIASGTVAGFIFAVIHPQGFVAVPALMALAYGFTLLREWRGTIIPGIVAHSLNNAIAMTALFLIFSD